MCELPPILGMAILGLSTGLFAILSINFANMYKKMKERKEVETSHD